jgi:hypothetical protein
MFFAISALCGFLSVGLLITAVSQHQRSLAACLWPTVMGVIRAAAVESRTAGAGSQMQSYIARVQYDYDVGGRTYHGDCIATGMPWTGTRTHPDELVLQYAVGSVAQVHYHPDERARSVLRIHAYRAGAVAAVSAVVAFAACWAALILAVH